MCDLRETERKGEVVLLQWFNFFVIAVCVFMISRIFSSDVYIYIVTLYIV